MKIPTLQPRRADGGPQAERDTAAALERVAHALHADPYRPDLLVERLLLHVLEGRHAAAAADLAVIERLGVARRLAPALQAAVSGTLHIRARERLYLLFPPGLDPAQLDLADECVGETLQRAAAFFGSGPASLVVELSFALAGLHHAASEVAGLGFIKLSPLRSLAEYEAVIAHEMAHVHLSSGNRFLDEGLAVLFQGLDDRGRAFVGTWIDCEAFLHRAAAEVFPLRAALAYDGRGDLFFERLMPDPDRRRLVYAAGHALAAHLLQRLGMAGVRSLCDALRGQAAAAHPHLIAGRLGEPIEALERRLCAGPEPLVSGGPADDVPDADPLDVLCCPLSPQQISERIVHLRAALARGSGASAKLALARGLVRRVLRGDPDASGADIAEMRSLAHEVRAAAGLPERDRALLDGWVAIVETHGAISVAARVVAWNRALELFRTGLARFPGDPEMLCATAALHLRGPVEYGADRAFARRCLQSARQVPGWAARAAVVEAQFGGGTDASAA